MRQRNQCGRLEALEKLPLPCSDQITPQLRESCCRHVEQLENDYWLKDGLLDYLDPVIVNVGSGTDNSDEDGGGEDDDYGGGDGAVE